MSYSRQELLICVVTRMLQGIEHVAVGNKSPIPGSAALLAKSLSAGAMRVSVLGSQRHNFFTDGSRELFDCAGQGRIGAFFLSGGQIDGAANLNLVGTGDYPRVSTRFPGSFGSAYLYFVVPRVILFREEHSRRVLVPKVDFVSAPGISPPEVYRPGGPYGLVTNLAIMLFDGDRARFQLSSVHPGHSVEEVLDNTGFEIDVPDQVPLTPEPETDRLALLRGGIGDEIAEVYPQFAREVFGAAA